MIEEFDRAAKALGNVLEWLRGLRSREREELAARAATVSAILSACIATRQLVDALSQGKDTTADGINAYAVGELWTNAANLVVRFDTKLFEEFALKAYGWQTGQWDHIAFQKSPVPRQVEEILAEAISLVVRYQKEQRITVG